MTQLCSSSSRFAVDSGKEGELVDDDTVAFRDGDADASGCPADEDSGVLGWSVEDLEIQPARLIKTAIAVTALRHH